MHILLISRSFPHHRAGGLEWHGQDIAEGLMEAGHDVSIITTPLPDRPELKPLRVNGTILELGRKPAVYDLNFFRSLRRDLPSICHRIRPDVIHAQGFAGIPVLMRQTALPPFITTIHGTLWSETLLAVRSTATHPPFGAGKLLLAWRYRHRVLFQPIWKWFIRRAPVLLVDSRFSRAALLAEAKELPRLPLVVSPGFDLHRYPEVDRKIARTSLGFTEDDLVLFSVGRLEPAKAPEVVIRSFLDVAGEFPNARLVMGGTGERLAMLRSMTRDTAHAARIHFPGRITAEELPQYFASADLFLNADMGNPAFGLTNAEALCYGSPVLTTPVGAHGEVVRAPRDGQLASPARWSKALAEWLSRLPEDEEARAARLHHARRRFARERMINRLLAVYQRLIR